jgi:transcriptional regulator with XRE-family HTH domain
MCAVNEEAVVPPVLRIDQELGRKIRTAREKRGWSMATLCSMMGPVNTPPRGLRDTQIARIEAGERNLSADEAWRLADLFEEIDAYELLVGARVVSPGSSVTFQQAIREESERRRRGEVDGYRGRELALAAVADTSLDLHRHTNVGSWHVAGQRPARLGLRKLHQKVEAAQALPIPA